MSNLFRTTIGSIRWRKKASQQTTSTATNNSQSNNNCDDQSQVNQSLGW